MVKAINDDEIRLRKRARRRLIGAIALVLLAIVVLPLVLDHQPAPLAPDLTITTTGENGDFRSRVVPAAPADPLVGARDKPAANSAVAPAETPIGETQSSAAALAPVPPNEVPRAVEKAGAPAAPMASKETEIAKPEKAEKAEKPETRKPVVKTQEPKPKKPQPEVDARARSDTYAVQLESFANAANARQLQEKLTANGVKSYTEAVETRQGKRTRVRVGPFATREAAEEMRGKLKSLGFSGIVRP